MPTDLHSRPPRLSRRLFLQTGALSAAVANSFVSWGTTVVPKTRISDRNADFLNGALEAARWIRSAEKDSAQGCYWLPGPDHPEKGTTVSPVNGIYGGSAGIVLFFLQVAKATGDSSYLEDATKGADFWWHPGAICRQRKSACRERIYLSTTDYPVLGLF